MAIETTLAVPDLRTVDPGPRRLTASFATVDGTPISGAAVTATGAASSLPLAMTDEAAGTYGAVVDIPPDADGTRSIAHELADAIEAGWRDLGIQVVPRHLLERGYFSAVNITDFMHHFSRGHPASFFIEQNQGLGTDKRMQKRIHVRSIQSVLTSLLERTAHP